MYVFVIFMYYKRTSKTKIYYEKMIRHRFHVFDLFIEKEESRSEFIRICRLDINLHLVKVKALY